MSEPIDLDALPTDPELLWRKELAALIAELRASRKVVEAEAFVVIRPHVISDKSADEWLRRSIPAFGGLSPIEFVIQEGSFQPLREQVARIFSYETTA